MKLRRYSVVRGRVDAGPRPARSRARFGRLAALEAVTIRHDDGPDDLVGERLPLRIPQREQEADIADDGVDDVADVAHEGHQRADRLAGLLADEPQMQHLLAKRLARDAALVPPVVDGPAQG